MPKQVKEEFTGPVGALKIERAAHYLSISPISVRRLIKRGELVPNRALRNPLLSIRELDRFLEKRRK
jgi:hypothetical protein